MRRRPSPSLVVSIIALVFAAAGTSIAAVNFAKNAGAVDGKSAVSGTASNARAAGKLVATGKSGKLPAKFLDLSGVVQGTKATFEQAVDVTDNATSAPFGLGGSAGLGLITATCQDENNNAGKENPAVTVTYTNTTGATVNLARWISNGEPSVSAVTAGATHTFPMNNSSSFRVYLEGNGSHLILEGISRSEGQGTAAGVCRVYGYVLTI